MARSIPYGSRPCSKRVDASERNPSPAAVPATAIGSNQAISSATTVVASLISVSAPPITPAMPIGWSLASAMSRSSAVNVRSTPSSVSIVSPSTARRMRKPPPPNVSRSYGWFGSLSSSIT